MAYEYKRAEKTDLDHIYSIFEESFPKSEIRDFPTLVRLFNENEHFNIYCLHSQNAINAVITVWSFPDFIFIENFATAFEDRGKGIGGALLDIVLERYQKPAFLEVEPPVDLLTKRRVAFYQRHGFVFNNFAYKMPPLHPGDDMLPLFIMSYPGGVSEAQFEGYKRQLYSVVYEYEG